MTQLIGKLLSIVLLALSGAAVLYADHLRIVAARAHQYNRWQGFLDVWPQYVGLTLFAIILLIISLAIAVMTQQCRP